MSYVIEQQERSQVKFIQTLNVISGLNPASLKKYGPECTYYWARVLGYDAIHALPLKNWDNYERLYHLAQINPHAIASIGQAWNGGGFVETLERTRMALAGEAPTEFFEPPTIKDYIYFGVNPREIYDRAKVIPQVFPNVLINIHRPKILRQSLRMAGL